VEIPVAVEQGPQRRLGLGAGQVRAQAVVDAGAEGQGLGPVPGHVAAIGIGPRRGLAVRGADRHHDRLVRFEVDLAQADGRGGSAHGQLGNALVAAQLGDGPGPVGAGAGEARLLAASSKTA
jgi:hypothetical protein